MLDRLVGYKISPLLWDKVRRGLSAGRVQTVALRLIVEREREIRAFEKEEYWTIDAHLAAASRLLSTPAFMGKGEEKVEVHNAEEAERFAQRWRKPSGSFAPSRRKKRRNPVRRSSPPRCSRNRRASCASA